MSDESTAAVSTPVATTEYDDASPAARAVDLERQLQQQQQSNPDGGDDDVFVVNLITSAAPLLPSNGVAGDFLEDCLSPTSESCTGGISAVVTYARNFTQAPATASDDEQQGEPYLMIQKFDKDSPFVNMHPLGWVVNRLILHDIFQLRVFISTPSLLLQNSIDTQLSVSQRDISELQTHDMPLLLSNTNVDVSHSWFPYAEQIHFDGETQLATMSIAHNTNVPLAIDPVKTVVGFTRYIRRINTENGCYPPQEQEDEDDDDSAPSTSTTTATMSYQQYLQDYPLLTFDENDDDEEATATASATNTTSTSILPTSTTCWVTVVLFSDVEAQYWSFLEQVVRLGSSNVDAEACGDPPPPPDIIINLEQSYVAHEQPERIDMVNNIYVDKNIPGADATTSSTTTTTASTKTETATRYMWVSQCPMSRSAYCQHRIHLSSSLSSNPNTSTSGSSSGGSPSAVANTGRHGIPTIRNVEFIYRDLDELPTELKTTTQWNHTILSLRPLAIRAEQNNPIVGYTSGGPMPVSRSDVDGDYRACNAGECPLGSLFTDAIRWYTQTDIAFTSSGGYRGPGWEEGPVQLTDLYAGMPFPNTQCVGTMSGLSLFRLFNYTTAISSFQGADSDTGGRLLQVSGARITYNTQLQLNASNSYSRLVSVEVWNPKLERYDALERTKLYTFSSDSYVCGAYDPYPQLTGKVSDSNNDNGASPLPSTDSSATTSLSSFVYPGEMPGRIGEDVVQNIVADYLAQLDDPWDVSTYGGRLLNDTTAARPLDFIQDPDSCPPNHVWIEDVLSCVACPSFENVVFSDNVLSFEADSDTIVIGDGRVVLVNRETTDVTVALKSKPSWVEFVSGSTDGITLTHVDNTPVFLTSGNSMALEFVLRPSVVGTGVDRTAVGTVSFGVSDGGSLLGCRGIDATFDVNLRVTPPDEYNYLGDFFYVGVAFATVVFLTAFSFTGFVFSHSKSRVIKVMQPSFLVTICAGVAILGSSMIPLGIDDGLVAKERVDIACMSIPWLISTGFTIAFSALFSKLWRINKLFKSATGFQRIVVLPQDVLRPFVVLFTMNTALLLSWTLVDPLFWERSEVDGQPWNTYGKCVGGRASTIFVSLIGAINLFALVLMCVQAYLARNISDEFSESKYIGVAVLGWLQTALIGVPILFLINDDNPTATYFLQVALVFVICMSMMSIIFAPVLFNYRNTKKEKAVSRVSVSGIAQCSLEANQAADEVMRRLSNGQNQTTSSLQSPCPSSRGSGSSGSLRHSAQAALNRIQLGMLDSINELPSSPEKNTNGGGYDEMTREEPRAHNRDRQKAHTAQTHRVSGEAERVAIESAVKSREMLTQRADLNDTSMNEHVARMMAEMEDKEDSSSSSDEDTNTSNRGRS